MDWLVRSWYQRSAIKPLIPLHLLYKHLVKKRRNTFLGGKKESYKSPVPVIVVGNITVGGTGKTPFVVWLVERLKEEGISASVVSRGYGGKSKNYPLIVDDHTSVSESGDEPSMLFKRLGSPVVVDPCRPEAIKKAISTFNPDVIISDDGLQHYAMQRDLEVVVVDGERGLGNGYCLPAGPLREPPERLNTINYIIRNGGQQNSLHDLKLPIFEMVLKPTCLVNLVTNEKKPTSWIQSQKCHGVAGIGNPSRFFKTLRDLGANVVEHPFPDHHSFKESDFSFSGDNTLPVVVTDKDAVKVKNFSKPHYWKLLVGAVVSKELEEALMKDIKALL